MPETIALSLFLVVGAWALAAGARRVWRGHASLTWPTVAGAVTASSVERSVSTDARTRRTTVTHGARVVVRYRVDGRNYETTTLRFGQLAGSSDPSEAAVRRLRYPVGSTVRVSHHPADPALATVEPGVDPEAFWLPGAGVAFATAGVLFVVMHRASTTGGGMATALTLFGLIFGAIGVALLAPGLVAVARGRASADWPAAAGVIVMGATPDTAGADTAGNEIEAGRVVYAYEAGGKRRYGNVRAFGQVSSRGGDAEAAIAARYPRGRAVTVRYAPDRPDLAVLEPGVAREAWMLPAAGLAFLAFGAAVLRWAVPALGG